MGKINKKLFDYVVLSCDDTTGFLNYAPLVIKAWKKLFDCSVILGLLNTKDNFEILSKCNADLIVEYPLQKEFPIQSQAKLFKSYLASTIDDKKVFLLNDIDMLPLATYYLEDKLSSRKKDELCFVSCDEFYDEPEMKNKYPIANTTGKGHSFKELHHVADFTSFSSFLKSFIGFRMFDDIEDPTKEDFSHESLVRALLFGVPNNLKVLKVKGDIFPFSDKIIDRASWVYDERKLYEGYYYASHMLRPYDENIFYIKKLEEYIDSL